MNAYIIYTNDNGTDSYPVKDNEAPEDVYRHLLDEHADCYEFTNAIYVEIENNKIVEQWAVYIPDLDEPDE